MSDKGGGFHTAFFKGSCGTAAFEEKWSERNQVVQLEEQPSCSNRRESWLHAVQVNAGWLKQKGIPCKVLSSSETWLKAGGLGLEKIMSKRRSRGLGSKDLSKGLWQKLSGKCTMTKINEFDQPAISSLNYLPKRQRPRREHLIGWV